MIGPALVGEEAIDDKFATFFRRVGQVLRDLGFARRHPDGVERDTAEEGEIIGTISQFKPVDIELRPDRTLLNPAGQQGDFLCGKTITLRRHDVVAGVFADAIEQRAPVDIAGHDGGPVGLTSLESGMMLVETQIALRLAALMAAVAFGLEKRLDLLKVIHLSLTRRF